MSEAQPSSLYIHIPFCRAKCHYCDFNSYPGLEALYEPYVAAVIAELAQWVEEWPELEWQTIYIGGGTPSVLAPEQMARLLAGCGTSWRVAESAEITQEANPGTMDSAQLVALRRLGITRLSLGVQSLDDGLLRLLGRIHTAQEAVDTFRLARQAGYDNINLDLMYGLPGQSLAQWQETLRTALALRPDHLSLYALTLHEETPLAQQIACGALPAPDDDMAAEMYTWARHELQAQGWLHYELSNWAARPESICRHNLTYWLDQPYLGIGAGAHSYVGRRRFWNVNQPDVYIQRITVGERPVAGAEQIDAATEMAEMMMLGLRLIEGVSYRRFRQRFGCDLREIYATELDALTRYDLIHVEPERVRLTERGYLLGNEVFERFLP